MCLSYTIKSNEASVIALEMSWSLFQKFIFIKRWYFVFRILHFCYMTVDWFLDLVFGYSLVQGWQKDRFNQITENGNLTLVLARGSSIFMGSLLLEDYIIFHLKYVNPEECILYNDNVQLMALSKTHAWFSVMPNDVDTNKYPFVFINQFWFTEQILVVDHKTLHEVAEKCFSPTRECVLISNTGRCGSTLLDRVKKLMKEHV